jgi:hypothetical protein
VQYLNYVNACVVILKAEFQRSYLKILFERVASLVFWESNRFRSTLHCLEFKQLSKMRTKQISTLEYNKELKEISRSVRIKVTISRSEGKLFINTSQHNIKYPYRDKNSIDSQSKRIQITQKIKFIQPQKTNIISYSYYFRIFI